MCDALAPLAYTPDKSFDHKGKQAVDLRHLGRPTNIQTLHDRALRLRFGTTQLRKHSLADYPWSENSCAICQVLTKARQVTHRTTFCDIHIFCANSMIKLL